jgi:hypothetical protein
MYLDTMCWMEMFAKSPKCQKKYIITIIVNFHITRFTSVYVPIHPLNVNVVILSLVDTYKGLIGVSEVPISNRYNYIL